MFWPDWPGRPHTAEFVELAGDTDVGIYPTLFPRPPWMKEPIERDDHERLLRYKTEFCKLALQFYADAPDGLSTFNWAPIGQPGTVARPERLGGGLGAKDVQMILHRMLGDRAAIERYLAQAQPLMNGR